MTNVNDLSPLYDEPDRTTAIVITSAVSGKRLVKIGATADIVGGGNPHVVHAGAAEANSGDIYGVAGYDAAVGALVSIWHEGIVPITTGEAITAGQPVTSGANGVLMHALPGQVAIGMAVADAGSGVDCFTYLDKFTVGSGTAGQVTGGQAAIANVATADATDLASAEALANANKAKINTILAELRTAGVILP